VSIESHNVGKRFLSVACIEDTYGGKYSIKGERKREKRLEGRKLERPKGLEEMQSGKKKRLTIGV